MLKQFAIDMSIISFDAFMESKQWKWHFDFANTISAIPKFNLTKSVFSLILSSWTHNDRYIYIYI